MNTHRLSPALRRAAGYLALFLLFIFSVGCNTAHGLGKDIENAGESIQEGTK
jgi:predicted small secreted protein